LLLISSTAFAEVLGDRIKPFISVREVYDSNVFRVKDKESLNDLFGDDQLHDFITIISAGVNLNYEISRQKIELLLREDLIYYAHYDDQNANQDTANGNLYLRVYDKFSAKINGLYTKIVEPKEYYLSDKKIYRTNTGGGIDLRYDMPLGFTIKAGFRLENVDYSIPELDIDERTHTIFNGGISYIISPDSEIDILYERDIIDYDKLKFIGGESVDNDSKGDTIKCVFYKKVGPETLTSLTAGYYQRKYDEFDSRDFNGFIGRADVNYRITEKVTLMAKAERMLYEEIFQDQTYSVNESIGLGASYKATEKIKAYIYGSTSKKTFKGDSNITGTDSPDREDDIEEFKTGAIWSPIKMLDIDLLYRYEKRDSNYDIYTYEDHGVELGISYKF
jgi:predicted transcriptional regulator